MLPDTAGHECALELGNLCTYSWSLGQPTWNDVIPVNATVKGVRIDADGTPCAGGLGGKTRAYLNMVAVGTAVFPYLCACTDCTTKTWEDAAPADSWAAYKVGGSNSVSFTDNMFAWAAVRVTVTYEVADSTVCTCQPGYVYDAGISSCKDIDECATGAANCAAAATCTNTDGGFKCRCPTNQVGDGTTCSDLKAEWLLDVLPKGFTWYGPSATGGEPLTFGRAILGWSSAGGVADEPPTLGIAGDSDGLRSYESDFQLGQVFDFQVSIYLPAACSDQQIAIFPDGVRWRLCSGWPNPCPTEKRFAFGYSCVGNMFKLWDDVGEVTQALWQGNPFNAWYTLRLGYRANNLNRVDATLYSGRPNYLPAMAALGPTLSATSPPWGTTPVRIGFGADYEDNPNLGPQFARFYLIRLQPS